MRKKIKTIIINFLILGTLLVVVELIFGGWLSKENNLDGLFVVRNQSLEISIDGRYPYHKSAITVTKDKYGFRGTSSTYNKPEAIDILCIGGSTTNQIYVEDGLTWPDVLEKELKQKGVDLNVANAGIDGQSTFGHIKNFELWFPLVPDLNPKYIFFYVGINDFYRPKEASGTDEVKRNNTLDKFKGKFKDNSVLFRAYRTLVGMIEANRQEVNHTKVLFDDSLYGKKGLLDKASYPDFFSNRLYDYKTRLELLVKYSKQLGATPVFITQPSKRFKFTDSGELIGLKKKFKSKFSGYAINGVDYYYLLKEMNKVIKAVANKNDLLLIEQTDLKIFSDEDFYDYTHTTPSGSLKIAQHITSSFMPTLSKD